MSTSLFSNYARSPLSFQKGNGVWLETEDGNQYLDFAAGIAVNSLGHSHPKLVEALKTQAEKLWHVSNLYTIPGQERLGQRLCEQTFADQVFFCNSGAEAIEASIKTARRYFFDQEQPERFHIVTFEGAFHGRTLATIAAGGQESHLKGFGPKAPGFDQVPLDDLKTLKAIIGPQTAAILIEPVQGEGGIRPVDPEFLRNLRAICDEHKLILIFDEIQCGLGRTGKLFAHQWAGIEPDIMAIAKGIGGGFPLGACLSKSQFANVMVGGTHGSTFGGNPLAMAVGNAVLDVLLADGFLDSVCDMGIRLKQNLAEIVDTFPDLYEQIRGEGLMLGLKCKVPNTDMLVAFRDEKLLTVAGGDNIIRFLPPLIVTEDEIRIAKEKVIKASEKLTT